MIAYSEFAELSQSTDSEERGQAAHLAALAYLDRNGTPGEQAALYGILVTFLDDPSVKVRAALAYGLLHSDQAPRPVMLALLRDSAIISRAVAQYSPVLVDADLLGLLSGFDEAMLLSVAQRQTLSPRLGGALVAHGSALVRQRLLRRTDVAFGDAVLSRLAEEMGDNAEMRGVLLARSDLPAPARLLLVQKVSACLREARIVKGALAPERLNRLLRNTADLAVAAIGEKEASKPAPLYAAELVGADRISTRLLLHALVSGHVLFFADCIGALSDVSRAKVFALLESGSRTALMTLLTRSGIGEGIAGLLARLVLHARAVDLAGDAAARHYVVTVLTEELIAEHQGIIPEELEEAFAYLGEQNIALARAAARRLSSGSNAITVNETDRLLSAA